MNVSKKSTIAVLIVLLTFILTGCSEKWIDAYNPAIDTFNKAVAKLNKQLDMLSNDNTMISKAGWKSDTKSTLAALKDASQGLRNLPSTDDATLKEVDALVKKLATESIAAVDGYNAMITAEDLSQIDGPNAHMDEINKILPQINELIDKYNK